MLKLDASPVLAGFALGLTLASTCQAQSWSVELDGQANAQAADMTVGYTTSYQTLASGPSLQQHTFTGTTSAASRGDLGGDNGRQAADAMISGTANVGALHGLVGADSSIGAIDRQLTVGGGYINLAWADTVSFHTLNPLGIDYTVGLTLDDSMTTSVVPDVNGFFSGGYAHDFANTKLVVLLAAGPSMLPVILNLQDTLGQVGTTLTQGRAPTRSLFATVHVYDGTVLSFQQALTLQAISYSINGTAGVNAADTAYFTLATSDADASYSAASGTVFSTGADPVMAAVPEPSEFALMLAGFGLFAFVARRRSARRR